MNKLWAVVAVIVVFCIIAAACSSSDDSSSSSKSGFYGSDGKYHNYVPEFGNDVNSWMAENW